MGSPSVHGPVWFPAYYLQAGLGSVLALVVALGFLSQTGADYAATIGVAVIGLGTAFLTRPWDIPLIGTLAATVLTGIASFGVHRLSDQVIAAIVGLLTFGLGAITHQRVTPKAGSPYAEDPLLAVLAGAGQAAPAP